LSLSPQFFFNIVLMGFFSWFVIVIVIGWLFFIYVFPFLLKRYLKRISKRFENQAQQASKPEKKDGSVSIDYIPEELQKNDKEAPGDYVDFEEIEKK